MQSWRRNRSRRRSSGGCRTPSTSTTRTRRSSTRTRARCTTPLRCSRTAPKALSSICRRAAACCLRVCLHDCRCHAHPPNSILGVAGNAAAGAAPCAWCVLRAHAVRCANRCVQVLALLVAVVHAADCPCGCRCSPAWQPALRTVPTMSRTLLGPSQQSMPSTRQAPCPRTPTFTSGSWSSEVRIV